jgi:MFS family permease
LGISSFSLFLHDWSVDLKVPISTLALVMTPAAVMTAISGPIVGGLADRYPARWLIGGGALGMAAFNLGLTFVTSAWQFLALFGLVLPILLSLTTLIVANPVVARWFVKRLGLALGVTALGAGLAGVISAPLIAYAMPLIGWRGVWRVGAAILAFGMAPLAFAVLRDRPTEREGLDYVSSGGAAGAHAHGGAGGGSLSLRQIAGRKNFWLIGAIFLPILSAYQGVLYNLAPVAASHALDTKEAGILLVVLNLVQMASTPVLGAISDRVGNRVPLLGLCGLTGIGVLLFAFGGESFPALVAASALVGAGGGLWTPLGAAIAAEYGSANAGKAFGLMFAFGPVAGAASFVLAKLKEVTGSYVPGLLTLTALLGISVMACLALREKRGGHITPEERATAMAEEAVSPMV